ncbi:hypothetical protein BDV29DRAFT_47960 [Aspergillus leporis]|uniref:Uncharacterized protein n=1 Tax=Aspergillus leporis TaxID=41062 RepID=A0A5N5WQZ2_9EURO|nr:hypothetical protein BDV29DRAFT_47960 [Aspergillus leporis]
MATHDSSFEYRLLRLMDQRIYQAIHSFLSPGYHRTNSRRHRLSDSQLHPQPPYTEQAHSHTHRARLRKQVRWGVVVHLPDCPRMRYYPSDVDGSVRRRSILKTQTFTDYNMYCRNLWAMIDLADQRLEYIFDCLRAAGDEEGLNWIMEVDEEFMVREANRRERARRMEAERSRLRATSRR